MSYFNTQKRRRLNTLARAAFVLIGIIILWIILRLVLHRTVYHFPLISRDTVVYALSSKRELAQKAIELQTTIESNKEKILRATILEDENIKLKSELGRDITARGILAHVQTIPNRSFYDTFIIDAGEDDSVHVGQIAYAFGDVALGTISDTTAKSATVLLYSQPSRETAATTAGSDVAVTLIGRGNGEYEVRMPRDVHFDVGGLIAYQSVQTTILAQIEKIVTDPRDPFQRLLAKAPVNLQALKWVIVR